MKKPIKLKCISYAEQRHRPTMIGVSDRMILREVFSCRMKIEMITVKIGAELLMISAKDTGIYHSANSAMETVMNRHAPMLENLKKFINKNCKLNPFVRSLAFGQHSNRAEMATFKLEPY